MNDAVVKKTQDTLGKLIKKPPLTEKLLSKPPFLYLHDIFSEVIRTTGFMKGLYADNEMKSENVKEKDTKIAFLQKAIDVVMLVSGESLTVKPARIVAGHEPEKTNELLQVIAKCCLNKMSSEDAVRRVLAGEKVDTKTKAASSRSQDKENKARHVDREEKKKTIERSGSRDHKDTDQPKEQESRRRDGEKDHRRDREHPDKHRHSKRDPAKDSDKDKSRDRERDREKDKPRGREREKDTDREKDKRRDKDRDKTRERDSHKDKEREREKRREREKETEQHKDMVDRKNLESSKVKISEESQQKITMDEPSKPVKTVPAPSEAVEEQSDSPARIPRPSSAKGQRRRPKVGEQDESDSEGDGDSPLTQRHISQENHDLPGSSVPSDVPTSSRRIPRPSSARPAPPRLKRQESASEGTVTERVPSAKTPAPVILDGKKLSEDEEDEDKQFLVEEAVLSPPEVTEKELEPAQELNGDEKHGGLVKKILETKKDYESLPSSPKEQSLVSEAARKKERELVTREIERLRSSIQTVCRSTLPLGKIMDYIQEDMDAMQTELQTWRRENKEHVQTLLEEQRATNQAIEPLKAELAELDQLIKDQQDKICAVKSNILRNEEKIQKMVTGVNFSSRT
ncbi:TRAF3-interacting protein 1 isoform 1-T1 [Synchiropus picturatus]